MEDKHKINKLQQNEYEFQFYGSTLDEFCKEVEKEFVGDITENVEALFQKLLSKQSSSTPDVIAQIKKEKLGLVKMLTTKSEPIMRNFQSYLHHQLEIPSYVLLPEDKFQDNQHDGTSDLEILQNRVYESEKKVTKLKCHLHKCETELKLLQSKAEQILKLHETFFLNLQNRKIENPDDNLILQIKTVQLKLEGLKKLK